MTRAGKKAVQQRPVEMKAYDISTFCAAHSVSRSYTYLQIKAGRLRHFKIGKHTLISREAAETWLRGVELASP